MNGQTESIPFMKSFASVAEAPGLELGSEPAECLEAGGVYSLDLGLA